MGDYLILDTETTALPKGSVQPYICQLAAVRFNRTGILDSFCELVDPEIPASKWDDEAIQVTNIGPDEVKNARPTIAVLSSFAEFVLGTGSLGAYNLPFDVDVIAAELQRNGLQHSFPWPPHHFDVATMAEAYMVVEQEDPGITTSKKGVKQPKLEEIYKHLMGHDMTGAHDAMEDVMATLHVFCKICDWSLGDAIHAPS